jgi:hypothetical protein
MESKQGRLEVEFDTTMSFFFGVETGVIDKKNRKQRANGQTEDICG